MSYLFVSRQCRLFRNTVNFSPNKKKHYKIWISYLEAWPLSARDSLRILWKFSKLVCNYKGNYKPEAAADSIAVGYQHNHKGSWVALKNIYKLHGVKGLWRGVEITVPRAAIGSTVQLTSFSLCKQWLNERHILTESPILVAFLSSMIGGASISLAMTPFDLVSVRIYNQGIDANGRGLFSLNSFFLFENSNGEDGMQYRESLVKARLG
ncbi:uncharacterized protein CBL_00138 [Carabus blaptoides fortunei]